MTKDERIAELEARVAQLERALGDEGRMLDEAARNAEDLVSELERVAREGETPIETLRRVLAEPSEDVLLAAARKANRAFDVKPSEFDIKYARNATTPGKSPHDLSPWGLLVLGYVTAAQRTSK